VKDEMATTVAWNPSEGDTAQVISDDFRGAAPIVCENDGYYVDLAQIKREGAKYEMARTMTISGRAGECIQVTGDSVSTGTYTDGNTSDNWQFGTATWWPNSVPLETEVRVQCNIKQEVKDMRGLYEIWVIDPDEEKVVFYIGGKDAIVADGEQEAKLIAAGTGEFPFGKEALRKYYYAVRKICDVPKPKEVQKVQMVEG